MTDAATQTVAGYLMSPVDRGKAIEAKRSAVLGWMRTYPWTHVDVLVEVTGLGLRAVQTTLAKMERDELIRSAHIQTIRRGSVRIWGPTYHGLHLAIPQDEPLTNFAVFEPSKVAISTLEHEIGVQSIHARALKLGWTNWNTADQVAQLLAKRGFKIPDAIATSPAGVRMAIELERTLKSPRRYEDLLVSYLSGRKDGQWQRVLYLSPTPEIAVRVERAYKSIRRARHNGQTFEVTPAHLTPFAFHTVDSFSAGAVA